MSHARLKTVFHHFSIYLPWSIFLNCCSCLKTRFSWNFHVSCLLYFSLDCGSLDCPCNGDVLVTDTTFGSIANYDCMLGYVLLGNPTRTCLDTGLWDGEPPCCEGKHFSFSRESKTSVSTILSPAQALPIGSKHQCVPVNLHLIIHFLKFRLCLSWGK